MIKHKHTLGTRLKLPELLYLQPSLNSGLENWEVENFINSYFNKPLIIYY